MENSKIEWTNHTFNPWMGCTKVSDGCKFCYAENIMDHRFGKVQWGPSGTRIRTNEANWKKPLTWNKKCAKLGIRQRVFCASIADIFEIKHDQLDEMNQWRRELFQLIEQTPNLIWLLLTKRPENVASLIEANTDTDEKTWFQKNNHVWVGTSAENQEQLYKRIPSLSYLKTRNKFLSLEPLLGPIQLSGYLSNKRREKSGGIEWVIVGGESGFYARQCNVEWVRSIHKQCLYHSVPFFFKQWGTYKPVNNDRYDFSTNTGDLLDGQQWLQFPSTM